MEEFEATVERHLVGSWQPWLAGLLAKTRAEYDGAVPATGDWTAEQLAFQKRLEGFASEAAEAYELAGFSPQRVTRVVCELVRAASQFGAGQEAWKEVLERSQERRTAVALELLAAKVLAVLTAPLMPDFADRLWTDLGHDSAQPIAAAWQDLFAWLPAGQRVTDSDQVYFSSVKGCSVEKVKAPAKE